MYVEAFSTSHTCQIWRNFTFLHIFDMDKFLNYSTSGEISDFFIFITHKNLKILHKHVGGSGDKYEAASPSLLHHFLFVTTFFKKLKSNNKQQQSILYSHRWMLLANMLPHPAVLKSRYQKKRLVSDINISYFTVLPVVCILLRRYIISIDIDNIIW